MTPPDTMSPESYELSGLILYHKLTGLFLRALFNILEE